jgi:prepilin-type N-terminal cleavage/methylation domain-containing protein
MKYNFKFKHAFTLIELIIAITILSIILISIFSVYSNIINANNKVKVSRILQENTKNIVENIATAIREK